MMKTHFALYAALLFMCAGGGGLLHAQEGVPFFTDQFSIGGGIEANGNARTGVSLGVMLHTEYMFLPHVSIGLKGTYSVAIAQLPQFPQVAHIVEASAFIRWSIRSGDKMIVPFLQPEAGTVIAINKAVEDKDSMEKKYSGTTAVAISTGLTAGVRFNVTEHFYIEPYGRFGYIYFWAGGIMFGGTFSPKPAGYYEGEGIYDGYMYDDEYYDDGYFGEGYYGDGEDIYGLSAYTATEDSIQSLIERILTLESYPDSNQDELYALNNLLDILLAQMEA